MATFNRAEDKMNKTNYLLDTKASKRFFIKVDRSEKDTECHLWTATSSSGYGKFFLRGQKERAHRIAYALTHGNFDKEMDVLHSCHTPSCVNPQHLRLGTAKDNARDMVLAGRCGATGQAWSNGELNGYAKLSDAQALEIRALYAKGDIAQAELGRRYEVSRSAIFNVVHFKTFKHLKAGVSHGG